MLTCPDAPRLGAGLAAILRTGAGGTLTRSSATYGTVFRGPNLGLNAPGTAGSATTSSGSH